MTSLSKLQHSFSLALLDQGSCDELQIVSGQFSGQQRMTLYRNNYVIGLTDVMLSTYPMVEQLLGNDCFESVVRHHVLHHPPTTGNTADYGAGFAGTLNRLDNITAAAPYICDVAKLEWYIDRCHHLAPSAADELIQPLSQLAEVPDKYHGLLRLYLVQPLFVLESNYAIASLKTAMDYGNLEDVNINSAQNVVIYKHLNGNIEVQLISQATMHLIEHLARGCKLDALSPESLQQLPELLSLEIVTGFKLHNY
jgi:hypothetical protein